MSSFQDRVNQLYVDVSFYWPQLTEAEKQVLLGLGGLPRGDLAVLVKTIRRREMSHFEDQFLPVAETIFRGYATKPRPDCQYAIEELEKDYCVLYEINQRMEKRLTRLELKKAKRDAKQARVKRYFSLRGKKLWENTHYFETGTSLHIKLTSPITPAKKRLVKGTPEYEIEKERLNQELDKYQAAANHVRYAK